MEWFKETIEEIKTERMKLKTLLSFLVITGLTAAGAAMVFDSQRDWLTQAACMTLIAALMLSPLWVLKSKDFVLRDEPESWWNYYLYFTIFMSSSTGVHLSNALLGR